MNEGGVNNAQTINLYLTLRLTHLLHHLFKATIGHLKNSKSQQEQICQMK